MSETKLRDVIESAIEDTQGDWSFITLVMDRLSKAMLLELDDGTVFVRRPRLKPLGPPRPGTLDFDLEHP